MWRPSATRRDRAGSDGGVAGPVDQYEASQLPALVEGGEGHGPVRGEVDDAQVVWFELSGRQGAAVGHLHPVLDAGHRGPHFAGVELEQVGPSDLEGFVVHPQEPRLELVCRLDRVCPIRYDVPPGHVGIGRQGERDGIAPSGAWARALPDDDRFDDGFDARGRDVDMVPGGHRAGRYAAAVAAEVRIRAVYVLNRHSEGLVRRRLLGFHLLQVVQQGRTRVPRSLLGAAGQIVAGNGRDRNGHHLPGAGFFRHFPVLRSNGLEPVAVPPHQVHLVDREHQVPDPEHGHDPGVARGLRQDALASVHQDDRQVRRGGPARQVARVLLVSRRVRSDEAPAGRLEGAVRDIDGDALIPLVLQAVQEQRGVGRVAPGSVAAGIGFETLHVIGEDLPAIAEDPPDEGALAVVHASAQDEPKGRTHQKMTAGRFTRRDGPRTG